MNLHVKLCAGWGLSPHDLERAPPAIEMLAYTRYVLDTGMRGDLLALQVALAPCVIGYAEIAARLAARPEAHAETNPYRGWIAEYAGAPYQAVAGKARAHLERLAESLFADLGEFSCQSQNLVFGRLLFVCGRPPVRRTFGSYVHAAR